ncbi:hypothetical protein AGDE_12520 [Angomonas deanei]|nr:hypothetical protein AGDE_12520 [Angomonas deanei]|eukprot:EPY24084.1 hypothetical protein AGDE_12520 [Angomonas deanei]
MRPSLSSPLGTSRRTVRSTGRILQETFLMFACLVFCLWWEGEGGRSLGGGSIMARRPVRDEGRPTGAPVGAWSAPAQATPAAEKVR